MSVIELATLKAKAGCGDGMKEALPAAVSVIAAVDGCLGASSLRCIERSDEFILRVEWVTVAAHEAFRATADFARFRAPIAEHLEAVAGFAHYDEM